MKVNIICIGNNLNSIYKDEIEEYFAESNHYSEKELKNIKPNKEEIYLIYHSNEVENDLKSNARIAAAHTTSMLRFVGDGENACEVHKSQRGVYNTHHLVGS